MVKWLARHDCDVTTLDDLSTGFADAVRYGELVTASLADQAALDRLFASTKFDAVMHFASFIQVGESVRDPAKYYRNNVSNTLNLLDAMVRHGVRRFIFSSTAAVFGEPSYSPIDERHALNPINPYGRSKLMVEQMLEDYDHACGLKSYALRYFNAAGADPECELGERHEPETHLIPLVLRAASQRGDAVTVFGSDYETQDGTCIRDYIHIQDICAAHWLSLEQLMQGASSARYNLGNGNGFSVREVISAAERLTQRSVPVIYGPRRPGDPARLVADAALAKKELGWAPRYSDLETIIQHAWAWEKTQSEMTRSG
ncbi:MAG: UDP-glucose 4-epimerase GalE [Sulfuricella denitrificans]|nr:UDP-glucose 4-epimerase GalE [Sulfuricella denitrificans]